MKRLILIFTLMSVTQLLGEVPTKKNTAAEFNEKSIANTVIESFSVDNQTLEKALEILEAKYKSALKDLYPASAMKFRVIGATEDGVPKVTLTIKNTSLKTIFIVLAEQSRTKILYKSSGVYFDAQRNTD